MIIIKTRVRVLDNSGGRLAETLNILSKSHWSAATIGDFLVLTTKRITPHKKASKGSIYKGIVVRIKRKIFRYGGIFVKFETNAVVLLSNKRSLIGTRILGIVAQELRSIGCSKILSLAPSVV